MSQYELNRAIKNLTAKLDEAEHLPVTADMNDIENQDLAVCRAVRSAFTYFIDKTQWAAGSATGESAFRETSSTLEALFKRAETLLKASTHPDAPGYLRSVSEKLQTLYGMQSGETFSQQAQQRDKDDPNRSR